MSYSRQLAAILFADIQGYTALMQVDEMKTKNLRDKFQQASENIIAIHNGRIVQFTGDGMMCFFNSTVDAVVASIEIQQQMQEEPKVPLRIGIHSGDVIIEDNSIYGDGVNLASRVESFAVPGSVLLTEKVFQDIKNKPEIHAVTMGRYMFKNVATPVEIFAISNTGIIVPSKKKLQGKGKTVSDKKWIAVLSCSFVLAIAIFVYVKYFKTGVSTNETNPDQNLLPASVRKSRIAVLPFENKTNDPNLNSFGFMAADYVIQSLLNLDKVKVVSFRSVEENLKYVPIGKSSGNRKSFADITGAEKIIKGSFYLQDDKILMQSQLIDARSGEVERVLPEISGSEKDLQSLVKELGSRFMSYFESRDEKNSYFETAVPKYEAYIKWREVFKTWGIDVPASRKILSEAIALDSSFLLPYMYYFASYHNQGAWKEAGSIFKLIEEKFRNPSPYEQNLLQVNRAMADGNLEETALGWKKLYQKDPKNIDVNIWAAGTAMGVMRYKEALTFFKQIDPANINYDRTWKPWWTKAYAICYFRLGMYDEARKIVGYIPEKYPLHIADPLLFLFTRRGQHDSLQLFLKKLSENPVITPTQVDSLFVMAAERYALVKDTVNQLIWTRLAIDRLKENPKPSHSLLIRSFYMAGEYQNALEATPKTITQNSTDWNNLSRLGRIYAKLGLHGKAIDVIHQIESVKTSFVHGENLYAIAEIYAALNEKEKAVDHMKKALQAGRGMNFNFYAEDFDFIPLHGYAPYEEFISPKD